MYVRVRFNGSVHTVRDLSKQSQVTLLRSKIEELTGLPSERQRLFHMGKQLEDGHTLFDYDVKLNGVIEITEKVFSMPLQESVKNETCETAKSLQVSPEVAPRGPEAEPQGAQEVVKVEDIYDGNPSDLTEPECRKCKGQARNCTECGCNKCGKKDRSDAQLICDECEYYYHFYCVGLEEVPEGDWYCPECKNDENEIVAPGAKLKDSRKKSKMSSKAKSSKSKRDWGSGMATAGMTKECTKVKRNHFGAIPGIEVGMSWLYRYQAGEEGVHRPIVTGIHGRTNEGAFSIALSGGYEDDVDNGEEFFYTGSGGRDLSGNKRQAHQSFHQELKKYNLALAKNCHARVNEDDGADAGDKWRGGKPVRVLRTSKLLKHSKYAPAEGCRYDGLYKVVKYWPETGKAGFRVWRYLLRRDDPSPAPWTEEGKKLIEANGYTCIYPPNYVPPQKRKADQESGPVKMRKTVYKVDPNLQSLIKADQVNTKIWNELLTKEVFSKLEFTDLVEEFFKCPVCLGVVVDPMSTLCSHNMCRECQKRLFKTESACPNCRKDIKKEDVEANKELKEALRNIMPGYDDEETSQ